MADDYNGRLREFLLFDRPVPNREGGRRFAEQSLRNVDPTKTGLTLRGSSVRTTEGDDLAAIVDTGLGDTLAALNSIGLGLNDRYVDLATAALLAEPPSERRVEQMLINRKIRDEAFRGQMPATYNDTWAVTGLRMRDGDGKAEARAAHIWSVADGGPHVVQNGIALSATAHWLFDRHLLSLTDDHKLLVSYKTVPAELRQLFTVTGQPIRRSNDPTLRPRREFMAQNWDRFAEA